MAVERLKQSPAAIAELGSPISAGFPSGHISVEDDSGSAELSFSATGPNGSGTVYADARKDLGVWRLTRLELEIDGRDRQDRSRRHASTQRPAAAPGLTRDSA